MVRKKRRVKVNNFKPTNVRFTRTAKIIEWKKSKKTISEKVLSNKIGQLQLKVLFSKKGRVSITEFGYSYLYNLSNKKELFKAKTVALRSAWAKVPFSPDSFDIIGEKYIYVESLN